MQIEQNRLASTQVIDYLEGFLEGFRLDYFDYALRLSARVVDDLRAGIYGRLPYRLQGIARASIECQLTAGGIYVVAGFEKVLEIFLVVVVRRTQPEALELLNDAHNTLLTISLNLPFPYPQKNLLQLACE